VPERWVKNGKARHAFEVIRARVVEKGNVCQALVPFLAQKLDATIFHEITKKLNRAVKINVSS